MNRKPVFAAAKAEGADFNKPGNIEILDNALSLLGFPAANDDAEQERLGTLSMRYETGFEPGDEAKAAAKVSSGAGDPGGKSYGAYQLSSVKGQVALFLKAEGAPWAVELRGDPTRPGAFEQAWRAVAARAAVPFFDAQHAYIQRTHYQPVADHARFNRLDIDAMPKAVRDAIWSISVQHGGAKKIVSDAIMRLGGNRDPSAVINALYDARSAYVRGVGLPTTTLESLLDRYRSERADALKMVAS